MPQVLWTSRVDGAGMETAMAKRSTVCHRFYGRQGSTVPEWRRPRGARYATGSRTSRVDGGGMETAKRSTVCHRFYERQGSTVPEWRRPRGALYATGSRTSRVDGAGMEKAKRSTVCHRFTNVKGRRWWNEKNGHQLRKAYAI